MRTLLVLGAAGGVGLASVQVGKALGARVLAGSGTAAKMEAALQAGADYAFDTSRSDWRATVQAANPGGIDVVLDPVGGSLTDTAFRMLRWGGRHLVVGFAAEGVIPLLRANLPLLKGAALVGVDLRQFREREPERSQANLADVVALFARGALRPRVARVHPAANWPLAMSAAADRSVAGPGGPRLDSLTGPHCAAALRAAKQHEVRLRPGCARPPGPPGVHAVHAVS